jgi:hypothetical protein
VTALYATLDPVQLLNDIRASQQHLVDLANHPLGHSKTPSAPPVEEFLAGLRTAWQYGEVRPTARSKPKQKRARRRPDPLITVTALLREWFDTEPWRTGRELLERLQEEHPGSYPDGLLRTVQRRLKTWRNEKALALVFGLSESENTERRTVQTAVL